MNSEFEHFFEFYKVSCDIRKLSFDICSQNAVLSINPSVTALGALKPTDSLSFVSGSSCTSAQFNLHRLCIPTLFPRSPDLEIPSAHADLEEVVIEWSQNG